MRPAIEDDSLDAVHKRLMEEFHRMTCLLSMEDNKDNLVLVPALMRLLSMMQIVLRSFIPDSRGR